MSGAAKILPWKLAKVAAQSATSPAHADPSKAFVIAQFWQLAADGLAEWSPMRDGNVELRLSTGEAFLLGNTFVTRIA
jgi:hypothetical protein